MVHRIAVISILVVATSRASPVVMVVYLQDVLDQKLLAGPVTAADIREEGAAHRSRPNL
jgi:hypothetical protein